MPVATHGHEAVLRLAAADPQWLPAVRAAVAVAERTGGELAGSWILDELRGDPAARTWYPNFRRLVTFRILEKVGESTRGGQRAYYRIIDVVGVRRGLEEVDRGAIAAPAGRLSFTAVGRSGRSDLSSAADGILRAEFPAR